MPYIPNTPEEQRQMLESLGLSNLADLFVDIPENLKLKRHLDLPEPLAEHQLLRHMSQLAEKNLHLDRCVSFLGAGAYDHIVPAVISHLISRGEFLTAYTPYQAEISQGVLQSIFEFQTLIANLTKMEAANASMYDGATALAEAALMACSVTNRRKVAAAANLDPHWLKILQVYLENQDIELITIGYSLDTGLIDIDSVEPNLGPDLACVLVSQPSFFGSLDDIHRIGGWIKSHKGLLVMAVDPISLGILKAPGEYGADIVVGDAGCLGNPISFGGPSVGFFAVADMKLVRKMPGRIVGQTTDRDGNIGYVLTLQAREQHIRREKATSNICTNQALNALAATIYLALLGPQGIREVAYQCLQKTAYLRRKLEAAGFRLRFKAPVFKEFVLQADWDWDEINERLLEHGYIGGFPLKRVDPNLADCVLIAVTEARTKAEMDQFVDLLRGWR